MVTSSLFDAMSLIVLGGIAVLLGLSVVWYVAGRRHLDVLAGGSQMLRAIGRQLAPDHPIRRRLEAAPVADLSLEEVAHLMTGDALEPAARALLALRHRIGWMERFAQHAVHLGILGTVFALVTADPTDLAGFRAALPRALGTTFWGLVGALGLSTVAGISESLLERGALRVREALLQGLESASA